MAEIARAEEKGVRIHVCEGVRPIVLHGSDGLVALVECREHPEHNVGMPLLWRLAAVVGRTGR